MQRLWSGTQPETNQYFGSRRQETSGVGAGVGGSPSAGATEIGDGPGAIWQRLDCAGVQARLTGLNFILNTDGGPCRL